jgi:hypothetical protein
MDDFEFKSNKTTFPYLKKGTRQKRLDQIPKQPFLKKGEGKLASQNHGETEFAKKRKEDVIRTQINRETEMMKQNMERDQRNKRED